jgi:hypothetical protein
MRSSRPAPIGISVPPPLEPSSQRFVLEDLLMLLGFVPSIDFCYTQYPQPTMPRMYNLGRGIEMRGYGMYTPLTTSQHSQRWANQTTALVAQDVLSGSVIVVRACTGDSFAISTPSEAYRISWLFFLPRERKVH